MRQKFAHLANLQEGIVWFPIMGLFFISTILLVILTGPGNFFELGQVGQRKTEQSASAAVPLPPPPTPSPSPGNCANADVNKDGVVDIKDVGEITSALGTTNPLYDLNGNGIVDIQDVQFASNCLGYVLPSPTPDPNIDTDKDGFKNGAEAYMGTDPFAACATSISSSTSWLPNIDAHAAVLSSPSPTPQLPAWPPDFNNDRRVDIVDIGLIVNKFGSKDRRYDLNQDGSVNIIDIGLEKTYFGRFCTI